MQTRSNSIYIYDLSSFYLDERQLRRESKTFFDTLRTLETKPQISEFEHSILFYSLISSRLLRHVSPSVRDRVYTLESKFD